MDLLKQDKELKEYKRQYQKYKLTLLDEIEDIKNRFDYKSLKEYNTDLRRFKRETIKAINGNYLSPYHLYMAKKWLKRTRIRNRDLLFWYIVYKYSYFNSITKQLEKTAFYNVNKHFVEETERQCQNITGKDYKMDYIALTDKAVEEPNNLGYVWGVYKDSTVDFNSNEMYNQIILDLRENQDNDEEILNRQENRLVKKNLMGTLDNEIDFITSYSQLQIFQKYGIKKVRVMGTLDESTCEVCEQYIGKVFEERDIIIGEQISSHINCRCYLEPIGE